MRVATTNNGTLISVTSVSCHDSTSIATTALASVTTLDRIDDSVVVTAVWTPPTSDDSRVWRSPVRVVPKNRSDNPSR